MNRTRSRWLRPRNESSKEAGTEEATERDEVRFAAPARSDVVVAAATIAADSANARPSGRTRRRGKRPRLPGAETDDDEVEWVNEPGAKSQNSALSQSGEAEFLKDDSGGVRSTVLAVRNRDIDIDIDIDIGQTMSDVRHQKTAVIRNLSLSVDINGCPYGYSMIQLRNVFVPQTNASVAHVAPDT